MALTDVDYLAQAQDLLPVGPAWPRDPDAFLTRLLSGLSLEAARVDARAQQILDEADPRTSTELLADLERMLALPDACQAGVVQQLQERRLLAAQKLAARGGQSIAYFLGLATAAGELNAWVDEFRPANCNSNVNATLNSLADRYTWRLNFRRAATDARVMNCNDGCGSSLRYAKPSLAQCPITDRKPAQTNVLFAYAVTSYKPADLQAYHTRSTNAWGWDALGAFQLYAPNVLRITTSPAGLVAALREPASTNYWVQTTSLGDAAWLRIAATITPNALASPSGAVDAASSVSTGPFSSFRQAATAVAAGDKWTTSVYAKYRDQAVLTIVEEGWGAAYQVTFNIQNGTVTGQVNAVGRISAVPNFPGWYRCEATFTVPAAIVSHQPKIWNGVYSAADNSGLGFYYWQPQLEKLEYATSPILTGAATVARSQDNITLPVVVPAGGTYSEVIDFLLPWIYSGAGATARMTDANGAGTDINTAQRFGMWNGANYLTTTTAYPLNTRGKVGASMDASGRSVAVNGGGLASDLNKSGAITQRALGQVTANGNNAINDPVLYIHEFRTYRWRLSAAELQAATA